METLRKFSTRLDVPENRLLSVMLFLSEQKENDHSYIETKIHYCFAHYGKVYYALELAFGLADSRAVQKAKKLAYTD